LFFSWEARSVGVTSLTKLIQCGPAGERSGFHSTSLAGKAGAA
jgi:hypothetical protein